jgi:hypothetical protein
MLYRHAGWPERLNESQLERTINQLVSPILNLLRYPRGGAFWEQTMKTVHELGLQRWIVVKGDLEWCDENLNLVPG